MNTPPETAVMKFSTAIAAAAAATSVHAFVPSDVVSRRSTASSSCLQMAKKVEPVEVEVDAGGVAKAVVRLGAGVGALGFAVTQSLAGSGLGGVDLPSISMPSAPKMSSSAAPKKAKKPATAPVSKISTLKDPKGYSLDSESGLTVKQQRAAAKKAAAEEKAAAAEAKKAAAAEANAARIAKQKERKEQGKILEVALTSALPIAGIDTDKIHTMLTPSQPQLKLPRRRRQLRKRYD